MQWCTEHKSPYEDPADKLCTRAAWVDDGSLSGYCEVTDAIVIERGVGEHENEWPEWALRTADYESNDLGGEAQRILDGLARGYFSKV